MRYLAVPIYKQYKKLRFAEQSISLEEDYECN